MKLGTQVKESSDPDSGDQFSLSLKFGGGHWAAMWLSRQDDPSGVKVTTMAGGLVENPSGDLLTQFQIYAPVNPCSHLADNFNQRYWGDYNELSAFGDGRFFAPYTTNGPGCRFQGRKLSDAHVGGSVFRLE